MPLRHDALSVAELWSALRAQGYLYFESFSEDPTGLAVLALARSMGPLYMPPGVDPTHPLIETRPSLDAQPAEPFDRAEAIGWHNDFSSHSERPVLSFAHLVRADPGGSDAGAWRVASCDLVFDELSTSAAGRRVLELLLDTDLPYSFTGEGMPAFHRPIETRGSGRRRGLRFYGRAMRDGARLAYGTVPAEIEQAVRAVESAAEHVGRTLAARAGALLVTDNWHSLHDRLPQTVEGAQPRRRSLLCFVDAPHGEAAGAVSGGGGDRLRQ